MEFFGGKEESVAVDRSDAPNMPLRIAFHRARGFFFSTRAILGRPLELHAQPIV
jgi:hypothetical protein